MAANVSGFLAAMARRGFGASVGTDSTGVGGFVTPITPVDPAPAPAGPFVDDAANSDAYTPAAPQATPAPSKGYTPQDLANAVAEWHAAAAATPITPASSMDEMAQGRAELARIRAGGYAQPSDLPMNPEGQIEPGNIDLNNRPHVQNPDGSVSTVRSISIDQDGKTYLIPTVVGGKVVSNEDAIANFRATGQHLGSFTDGNSADAYAQQLHQSQAGAVDLSGKTTPVTGNSAGEIGYDALNALIPQERHPALDAQGNIPSPVTGRDLINAAAGGMAGGAVESVASDVIPAVRGLIGGIAGSAALDKARQEAASHLPTDGVGGALRTALESAPITAITQLVGTFGGYGIGHGVGEPAAPGVIQMHAGAGGSTPEGLSEYQHPQLPEELAGPIRDALNGHAAYEDSGQLADERSAAMEQRIAAARKIAAEGGDPTTVLGGATSEGRPTLDLTPEQVDAARAIINRDAATNPKFFTPVEAVRALDLAAEGRPVPPSLRSSLAKYVTEATAPAGDSARENLVARIRASVQKEIADTGSLSAESRAALNDGLTPDEVRSMVGDESATAHAASQSSLFDTPEEAAARPAVPRKGPIEPIVGPTGYVDQPPLGGRTPPPEPSGTPNLPNNEGGFPLHAQSPAMPLEDELANFPKYDQPGDLPSGKSPDDIRRALRQAWADGRQASGYGDTQPGTPGGFPLHSAQPALDMGDPLANFPKYDQPGDLPSGRTPEDIRRALQQAWMDGRDGTGLGNTADRGATQPALMPPDATPLTAQAQRAYRNVASRIVTSPIDLINQGGRAMQFAFDFVSPVRLLHTAGSADLPLYGQMWAKVAKAAVSKDVSEYVQRQWDATTSKPLITNRGTPSQGEAYLKISDVFAPRSEGGYALPGTRINPDGLPSTHNGTDYGILSHLPGRAGQQINARLQILGLFQKMWGPEMLHMHLQNALDAGEISPADLMNPAVRTDAGRSVSLLEGHSSIPASNLRPLGIFINTPDWLLSNFELVGRAFERGTLTGAAARTAITRVVSAGTAATYALNLAQGVKPNDPRMYRNHVPMILMTKPVTDALAAATGGKLQFKPDSQIDAYGTLGTDTQHVIGLGDAAITGAKQGGFGGAVGSAAKEGAYWAAGQASTVGRLGMLVSDQLVHSPKDTFGHPITPGSYAEPFKPIPLQQTNASSGAQFGGQLGIHIYEPPTPKAGRVKGLPRLSGLKPLPPAPVN